MVVDLNSSNRSALALIRGLTDNFLPTDWTTGDLSTGTLTPIFDSNLHEIIPVRLCYQYAADNNFPNKKDLLNDLNTLKQQMVSFYSLRNYKIFTVTIASPGVFSRKEHNLSSGDRVIFSTSSALPTGISANTWYWVISDGLTDNEFEISSTKDGTAITTSGSQTGTHWFATDKSKRMNPNTENNK